MIRVTHEGASFSFSREEETRKEIGRWYCVEHWKGLVPGSAVSRDLGQQLTKIAISQGIREKYNFSREKPKRKPTGRTRAVSVSLTDKRGGVKLGGLNPFKPSEVPTVLPVSEAPKKKPATLVRFILREE